MSKSSAWLMVQIPTLKPLHTQPEALLPTVATRIVRAASLR